MQGTRTIFILLLFSLIINSCFIYIIKTQSVSDIITDSTKGQSYIRKIYDLNNYKSTSYESKTLLQRIDRMHDEYMRDKISTKESRYLDGEIDPSWQKKCIVNLRRISVISAKLEIIERILNTTIAEDVKAKQEIDMLIEQKGYHEKLMDMSNFYAQFVSEETYNVIQTTLD